jgi:hypothetical protein
MAETEDMARFLAAGSDPLESSHVVDADVHITYNEEVRRQVATYMEKPYRDYVDPDTSKDPYPSHGWPKSIGGNRSFQITDVTTPADVTEPLFDGFGVDQAILNVLAPGDAVLKTERGLQETRAINDWMLDTMLDAHDDLYGLITLAGRDPQHAAEEIDRLADEESFVGGFFILSQEFTRPAGDPTFDVVHEALERNDLPAVYHITGIHRKARILRELEKVSAWHATGPAWSAQLALTNLVLQGVPEKFPDLDLVLLEGGIGWVPGWLGRLNREYSQWRSELPLLEKSPEQYVRESVHFGTQPLPEFENPDHMANTIDMIGADSLMFATDHPHYDFDHPRALDKFLSNFDDDDRERVLAGNAQDVFELG